MGWLQFLGHLVVTFFGFLYFFGHGFLFDIEFLHEFIGVFDLIVDECDSVGESGACFLFGLIDENSSYLFEYLGV